MQTICRIIARALRKEVDDWKCMLKVYLVLCFHKAHTILYSKKQQ